MKTFIALAVSFALTSTSAWAARDDGIPFTDSLVVSSPLGANTTVFTAHQGHAYELDYIGGFCSAGPAFIFLDIESPDEGKFSSIAPPGSTSRNIFQFGQTIKLFIKANETLSVGVNNDVPVTCRMTLSGIDRSKTTE